MTHRQGKDYVDRGRALARLTSPSRLLETRMFHRYWVADKLHVVDLDIKVNVTHMRVNSKEVGEDLIRVPEIETE